MKLTVKRGTEQNIYSKKITVSTELNAIFSKSASSGLPPLTVNLDASASTGFITEQLWVISPSTGFTYVSGNSGSVQASVKFTTGGVYNVSLRLTDGSRIIESAKQTITVKNQPVVDFDWPKPVYVGRQIQFTDRTQFPCVTGISHLWTFPSSPVNSSAQNPVFTFTAAGTWDVKLCVTDGCGNNVCINKKVEVLTPTTNVFAQFTSSKISVMKAETVDFYDTSTPRDDIKTWIWNFELPKDFPIPQNYTDAGNVVADKAYFSYQEKASHQFNTAGTFKVRLGVEGAYNPSGPIPRTFFEQIIEVREIPVLKSGKQAQYTDNFMSDNVYATSNSRAEALALAVLRKNGATSSSDWGSYESLYYNEEWKYFILGQKIKDNKMIVHTTTTSSRTANSYQIFDQIGLTFGQVRKPSSLNEIQSYKFASTNGQQYPKFDIYNDEVAVVQTEPDAIYLYLIKRGNTWSTSTVTKVKILDGTATLGDLFIDASVIVAHIGSDIVIYERGVDGVWDFANRKNIVGAFKDIAYHNGVIMTTSSSCVTKGQAIASVYYRPAQGWYSGIQKSAQFFIDDDEIQANTSICIPDKVSIDMSETIAVLKARQTTGATILDRVYVYRRWNSLWENSKQTYKVNYTYGTGFPPSLSTSNYDGVIGTLIFNYENYCTFEQYSETSFSKTGVQHDVKKGLILLGGGNCVFNSGAKARYIGIGTTLTPGVSVKQGSDVSFKAVAVCDELYYDK